MNSTQKRSFFTKTTHQERGHSSKLLKMEDSFGFIPVFMTRFQLHCILTHTTKLKFMIQKPRLQKESGYIHDVFSIQYNVLFTIVLLKPSYTKW